MAQHCTHRAEQQHNVSHNRPVLHVSHIKGLAFLGGQIGAAGHLPEEYARYNRLYATRMLVKPGITGPWQVSGRSFLSASAFTTIERNLYIWNGVSTAGV